MSAILGEFSTQENLFESLLGKQSAIWKNRPIETMRSGGASIGLLQHTSFFPHGSPVMMQDRKRIYALHGYMWQEDGFPLSSQDARKTIIDAGDRLIEKGDPLDSAGGGVFTLVVFDTSMRKVWIANDLSGILPLYYSVYKGSLLFSSHSRPLAEVLNSRLDKVGVVQTAAFHYSIGSRTFFEGIERLCPGEVLSYSLGYNKLDRRQTSRMYGSLDSYRSDDEAADALWQDYISGMKELSKPAGKNGVLLSGGFDTRLVVRGFSEFKKEIAGVTFGEMDNNEVRIAQKVASLAAGKTIVHSPIEDCHPSNDRISLLVSQAESANFVYCETAARMLQEQGAISISTGYGGETFFGGQAFSMLGSAWDNKHRLTFALKRSLSFPGSGFSTPVTTGSLSALRRSILSFHNRLLNRSAKWLVGQWHPVLKESASQLEQDISSELQRFAYAGHETIQQICERFWLEHHVLKHFGRQEFTISTRVPIVLPTVSQGFMQRCSNLNPSKKVDHGMYLRMIRRHFGAFATLPTSNIPMSLLHPDALLWVARALRARRDQGSVNDFIRSRGEQRGRRAGWAEFEVWMRDGSFLQTVGEMVDGSLFDTDFVRAKGRRVLNWEDRAYSGQEFLTPVTISGMISGFNI